MKPIILDYSDKKIITENSSWFKHWFDSSFYHQLYANRNEKEAADFIDELIATLQPLPGSAMLDLGCGNGRHSKQLAGKGFNVTGIDLAASSINMAKRAENSLLHFYRHDMRKPFGENQFDYVLNFFTSFGYFNGANENQQVVANISRSLRGGGVLVMDYLNVQYAEDHLVKTEEKEIDGIVYHIKRWSDEMCFHKKITIDTGSAENQLEYTERVAKFNLADFHFMFRQHGLCIETAYGDYGMNSYDKNISPRLIMTARKL